MDERFLLPNLYAQGTSKHVRGFNCVQRSHQHIFETFTTAVVGGLVGAVTFPICSAMSSLMYAVGEFCRMFVVLTFLSWNTCIFLKIVRHSHVVSFTFSPPLLLPMRK